MENEADDIACDACGKPRPRDGAGGATREEAAAEWENVERTAVSAQREAASRPASNQRGIITHAAAVRYFEGKEANISRHRAEIVPVAKGGGAKKGGWLKKRGPPRLGGFEGAELKRDFVFLVAKEKLDDGQPAHVRMLQTVYKRITGDGHDCPRYGSHWELVGFQGNDPGTDLRDVGMFGLLQMLFFTETRSALALRIHRLSRDKVQHFPFLCVGINFSLVVLQTLRDGALNAACNRAKRVLEEVHELYMALWHAFYTRWVGGSCSIADFGTVLAELKEGALKQPAKLVDKLRAALFASVSGGLGDGGYGDAKRKESGARRGWMGSVRRGSKAKQGAFSTALEAGRPGTA